MDADKDAICALMQKGLYGFDSDYDSDEDYNRAEALWGKWCDPERVTCPRCEGDGLLSAEEWWADHDGNYPYPPCPDCYGTGKVRPPSSPPPPPPRPIYTIVNGGTLGGWHRAIVMRNDRLYYVCQSALSYDAALSNARVFVANAEEDDEG